jgi:hypothetical protein
MKRYRLDETLLESESGAWVRYDDHMKELTNRDEQLTQIRQALGSKPLDGTLYCVNTLKNRVKLVEAERDQKAADLQKIRSAIGCGPLDSTLAVIDQMVRENTGLRKPAQAELDRVSKNLAEEKQRHQSVIDAHTKLGCHAWYCTIQLAGGVCNCPQQIFQFNGMKERYARERAEIQDAFAPVLSWYQAQGGEQSPRTLGAMIADAVADLIKDRKDALKLKAAESRVAELERLLSNQMRWEKRVDELPAGHGFYVRPDGSVPPNSPLGTTAAKATSDGGSTTLRARKRKLSRR